MGFLFIYYCFFHVLFHYFPFFLLIILLCCRFLCSFSFFFSYSLRVILFLAEVYWLFLTAPSTQTLSSFFDPRIDLVDPVDLLGWGVRVIGPGFPLCYMHTVECPLDPCGTTSPMRGAMTKSNPFQRHSSPFQNSLQPTARSFKIVSVTKIKTRIVFTIPNHSGTCRLAVGTSWHEYFHCTRWFHVAYA